MIKNDNLNLKRKRQPATPLLDTATIDTIDLTEEDVTPVAGTSLLLSKFDRHVSPFELQSQQPGFRTDSLDDSTARDLNQYKEKSHHSRIAFETSRRFDRHSQISPGLSEHHYTPTSVASEGKRPSRTDRGSSSTHIFDSDNQSKRPGRDEQALSATSMAQTNTAVSESFSSSPPVMSRLERMIEETTTPPGRVAPHFRMPSGYSTSQTCTDSPVTNLDADMDTDMVDATPHQPQPQQNSELYKIPELATPYIPHTSMLNAVEYSNPQKFSLHPPFWTRWSAKKYSRFAEHLRQQFDPIPFAQELDIPVEEVQHVFTALVIRPLNDAGEAARRGEKGMQEIMDLCNKYGGQNRRWGRGGEAPGDEPIYGVLAGVEKQVVILTTEVGFRRTLRLDQLSGLDIDYLLNNLLNQDEPVFWAGEAETETDLERLKEKYGSQIRHWGARRKDGKRLYGTMMEVTRGVVHVKTRGHAGKERQPFPLEKFVEADERCLAAWLSMEEQRVLRAEENEEG